MQPARTTAFYPRTSRRTFAVFLVSAFPFLSTAQTWNNPGTGDWFTGSNWSSGLVPDANGDVTIDAGTAVISDEVAVAYSVVFGQTVSGSEASLTIDAGGALFSHSAQLGYTAGTNGVVTLAGADSQWTITEGLTVGRAGDGSIFVSDGAILSTSMGTVIASGSGTQGIVTIAGEGTQWTESGDVYIGASGNARLNIQDGATVSFTSLTSVAEQTGGTAIINLVDATSTWNTHGLNLGYRGTAELTIADDATLANTGDAALGGMPDSSATAELQRGGHWTNTGDLNVGVYGEGVITLRGESALTAANATLGVNSTSNGWVTLEGASSWTNSGSLTVGSSGLGTLSIYEGSTVSNTAGVIASNAYSQGTVEVSGENSLWTNTVSLHVGVDGTALLKINDGGRVSVGGDSVVTLGSSGEILIGSGSAAGTLDAATVTAISGGKVTFDHNETAYEFSTSIAGTVSITQAGGGLTILTGTNTFSGFTTVRGGTLAAGGTDVLSANSAIFLNDGATLDLGGYNQTVGDLDSYNFGTGSNDFGVVQLGGATLTNLNRVTNNWAGTLAGNGTVVKQGAIMNWYGVNLFTGILQVDSGILNAEATNTLSPNAIVSIASGATVQIGDKSQTIAGLAGAGFFVRGSGTLTINQTVNTVFSGNLSGWGTVIKSGAGTLTLSSGNTISGDTSVEAGSLIVDGFLGETVVTVNSGATLGGSGSVYGSTLIESGAHLAPGSEEGGPGTLTFTAGLTFASGSILDLDLGAVSDKLLFSDGELLRAGAGTITVNLFDSGGFTAGTYDFIDATGAVLTNIDIDSFELGTVIAGYDYAFTQNGNRFQLTATAVPEPATCAALLGALTLAVATGRRRR